MDEWMLPLHHREGSISCFLLFISVTFNSSTTLLFLLGLCQCFNIDVKHPRVFTGPEDAQFGFSVLQHEADGEKS